MNENSLPFKTIVEALLKLEGVTNYGARFVSKSGEAVFHSYQEIMEMAKSAAGVLQARGLEPGERVAIILTTSVDFLFTFLGVQLAGGIPTALYPPVRLGRLAEYYRRTQAMLTGIGARFLITENRLLRLLGRVAEGVGCLDRCFLSREFQANARWEPVETDPESPALLQFTSGTTSEPRAVTITHINLLHNLEAMNTLFRSFPKTLPREGVCWLPLYHDMGLIGCMFNGLYHPGNINYVSPEHFIVKPALWLQTISRYRAPISPSPQFAYGLCVNKIRDEEMNGVDLSCWIAALNGAEPLDIAGFDRFTERFSRWGFRKSAMTPVYGMAEAGLAISFSDIRKPPVITEFDPDSLSGKGKAKLGPGKKLVSVGTPMKGLEIRIQDEHGNTETHWIGEILIRGPSISPGYFNDPESTAESIQDGWLHTGDIGFLHEGEIYIIGRAKDVIIVNGRNIAPQEIERLVDGLAGVRAGCAIALGAFLDGRGERVVLLAERDKKVSIQEEELIREIRSLVLSGIGVDLGHVEILSPGTLPRTSSGKLRRADAGRMFFSGELTPPHKMGLMRLLMEAGRSQIAWARFRQKKKAEEEPHPPPQK